MTENHPVIIDNGTAYTRIGFAGNSEPDYTIPTVIAEATNNNICAEWYIGKEALRKRKNYHVSNCLTRGIINNWNSIEKYWETCFFKYLNCDPEEHYVLLTEQTLNSPENREKMAEIMFETFNVPGLYIGAQPMLSLMASRLIKNVDKILTGAVIEAGVDVTHVIPIVDGNVIDACIKQLPLGGRSITKFILQMLRDRGEQIPLQCAASVARQIKETYCYCCADIVKEYARYDRDETRFQVYNGKHPITNQPYKIDVGYERFLGPELYFNPTLYAPNLTPLPQLVDECIQNSPFTSRNKLYENIVLSGSSTIFKDFARRLERDVKRMTQKRQKIYTKLNCSGNEQLESGDVKVIQHRMQKFAAWFGGSMLASLRDFSEGTCSRQEYEEFGCSIVRNITFNPYMLN
eukprot:88654_1